MRSPDCVHVRVALLAIAALAVATTGLPVALAHGPEQSSGLASAWSLSPWLLVPGAVLLTLYAVGLARLWSRAGIGHGLGRWEACSFAAGVAALFLATVWPLDALGESSLAAHMAQHMLLLAFAPPLLLAGRPLAVIAHSLPRAWSGGAYRLAAEPANRLAPALAAATAAHVAVMAIWHLPSATAAALGNDALHWAMHGSFLLAGLWFWAAVFRRVRDPDTGAGAGVVAIVAVMMQMGFVGALLTFATRPLYPVYVERAAAAGISSLADQQLAGLIMWVPACLPYLLGGVWLVQRALERAERRSSAMAGHARPFDRPS